MNGSGLAAMLKVAIATSAPVVGAVDLSGCRTSVVQAFGAPAGIAYRMNEDEERRRLVEGSRIGLSEELLEVLLALPHGLPVALDELTRDERVILRRAPSGTVECVGGKVVRQAVTPLTPRLALVAARDWRVGLRRAGRFAPYCARAMLLPRAQAEDPLVAAEASIYGVGVGVVSQDTSTMVLSPRPYLRVKHSAGQWRFAEALYEQITGYATGVSELG